MAVPQPSTPQAPSHGLRALGWAQCQNAAKRKGDLASAIAPGGGLGAPVGKLRQRGGLHGVGVPCVPQRAGGWQEPALPPAAGTPCAPCGTSTGHPALPAPGGAKGPSALPGLRVSHGVGLGRGPGRERLGTAAGNSLFCCLNPFGHPPPASTRPRGSPAPAGKGVQQLPAPSSPLHLAPTAVPLPEPLPLCVSDHREAPGTHPQSGLPGGGDAVSVPGTQVLCLLFPPPHTHYEHGE